MLDSIMELLVGSVVGFKRTMIGDAGWGVYFLLLAGIGGATKYLYMRWTKQYDPESLKKKWLGLGHVVHWLHSGRNTILRWGSVFGSFALCGALVAAGASKSGQAADASSALTTLPPSCYLLTSISEEYNDTSVVYIKRILRINGTEYVTEKHGRSILIPPNNRNRDDGLEVGQLLSVSLFEGQTLIGKLNDQQVIAMTNERNGRWWNWLSDKADGLLSSRPEMAVAIAGT